MIWYHKIFHSIKVAPVLGNRHAWICVCGKWWVRALP